LYVAAVASFTTVTTVADVDDAILEVNTAVTNAAAVTAVKAASVALNTTSSSTTKAAFLGALANDAFKDYDTANDTAYVTAVADFITVADVAAVNTAIAAVNTEVTEAAVAAAVAAINTATTTAALNEALDNDAFEGYVAANYDAYFDAIDDFNAVTTVDEVNTAIEAVNDVVVATAKVAAYEALPLTSDEEIVAAVNGGTGAEAAVAAAVVAALPEGTSKDALLARITAQDEAIITAATIGLVTVANEINITGGISKVKVTAVLKNAAGVELSETTAIAVDAVSSITYAWSLPESTDLTFDSAIAKSTLITNAAGATVGEEYTIQVIVTPDFGSAVTGTSTVTCVEE